MPVVLEASGKVTLEQARMEDATQLVKFLRGLLIVTSLWERRRKGRMAPSVKVEALRVMTLLNSKLA